MSSSAKEAVFFSPTSVGVIVFQQDNTRSTELIYTQFGGGMEQAPGRNHLNCGSDPVTVACEELIQAKNLTT